jgi:hypothetical protein
MGIDQGQTKKRLGVYIQCKVLSSSKSTTLDPCTPVGPRGWREPRVRIARIRGGAKPRSNSDTYADLTVGMAANNPLRKAPVLLVSRFTTRG